MLCTVHPPNLLRTAVTRLSSKVRVGVYVFQNASYGVSSCSAYKGMQCNHFVQTRDVLPGSEGLKSAMLFLAPKDEVVENT